MPKLYRRYKKKSRRGRYGRMKRMKKRAFAARVKKVILKAAETKRYQFASENVQLYHNNGTSNLGIPSGIQFNSWSSISLGTNRFQRVGDQIYPRGMALRLWLSNKSDRPNVLYRVIVCVVPKIVAGTTTSLTHDPFFVTYNAGSNNNILCAPVDPEKVSRVFYDKIISVHTGWGVPAPGGTNKEYSKLLKLWIRRKKRGVIEFDGANSIKNNPILIGVYPYDAYGTLATDNIASCAYVGTMYFKDV